MTTYEPASSSLGKLCQYCHTSLLAPSTRPTGTTVADWHGTAKCVEGDEPSYKMGGPA